MVAPARGVLQHLALCWLFPSLPKPPAKGHSLFLLALGKSRDPRLSTSLRIATLDPTESCFASSAQSPEPQPLEQPNLYSAGKVYVTVLYQARSYKSSCMSSGLSRVARALKYKLIYWSLRAVVGWNGAVWVTQAGKRRHLVPQSRTEG